MPGTDLTIINDILKEDYRGPLAKVLNDSVGLRAQLERNTTDFAGKYAVVPIHFKRGAGFGFRAEKAVVPSPGSPDSTVAHVEVKNAYMIVGFTRQAIDDAAKSRGAFVRTQRYVMDDAVATSTRRMAMYTWLDDDGVLAVCGTTAGSTTVVLATDTPEQMLVNMAEGMVIDIGTVANPTLIASDRVIESVDLAAKTIVISGAAVTTSATHRIFEQGSGGAAGGVGQKVITGVGAWTDASGSLHGITATGAGLGWLPIVDTAATNRPPSENLIESVIHRAKNRSGAKIDSLWAEDGVFRAAVNLLKGRQRDVNTLDLKGGHKAIDYTFGAESMPLVRDRDATPGSMFGFEYDCIQDYVCVDWEWEDELGTGNVLRLSPSRTHEYEAWFYTRRDYGVSRRNRLVRIDDLETA